MEIEVGEYVRTDKGYIRKEENKEFLRIMLEGKSAFGNPVKHSKNIIDLIEDTDILKVEISEEWVIKEDTIRFIIVGQTNSIEEIKEALENGIYKIKSIVTKEQFSQVEYKVESEKKK